VSGELTSPVAITLTLTLKGCELESVVPHQHCQGTKENGELVANLEGTLGYIKKGAKPALGLVLRSAAGAFIEGNCGEAPLAVAGTLIAPVGSGDKMGTTITMKLKNSHGHQVPEQLE